MLEPRAAHEPAGREPMGEPQVATTANSGASADPAGAGGGGVRSQAAGSGSHANPAGAGGVHSQATPAADSGSHAVPAGAGGTPATAATTKDAASAQYTENDAWTAANIAEGQNADVAAAPNLFEQGGRALVGVGDKAGHYSVHDRVTGELIWQKTLLSGMYRGGVIAPATYQNDTVYVISNEAYERGIAYALRAADGSELWQHPLPHPVWGGPAIGNGVLYLTTSAGEVRAHAVPPRTSSTRRSSSSRAANSALHADAESKASA